MFPIDRNCEVINSEVLAIAHTDEHGKGSIQETAKESNEHGCGCGDTLLSHDSHCLSPTNMVGMLDALCISVQSHSTSCGLSYQQYESFLRHSVDHLTTCSTPSHLQLPTVYWVIPESLELFSRLLGLP